MDVLSGVKGPCRDIVLINAAAGIVAAGVAKNIKEGIAYASLNQLTLEGQKINLKL